MNTGQPRVWKFPPQRAESRRGHDRVADQVGTETTIFMRKTCSLVTPLDHRITSWRSLA